MAVLLDRIIVVITVLIFARVIASFVVPFLGQRPHPLVLTVSDVIFRITEPILGPIRRVLPSFGGLDFSPMVVLIILFIIRQKVLPSL